MLTESIKPPTLLVVDDDPAILALVDRVASEQGFAVIKERDSRAALRNLSSTRPEGAIVDADLAELHDFSLLREIKAQPSYLSGEKMPPVTPTVMDLRVLRIRAGGVPIANP